tara:strand:- start:304 stop:1014 length:711 start_codon:yes stop_codon:yes gene_type:complete
MVQFYFTTDSFPEIEKHFINFCEEFFADDPKYYNSRSCKNKIATNITALKKYIYITPPNPCKGKVFPNELLIAFKDYLEANDVNYIDRCLNYSEEEEALAVGRQEIINKKNDLHLMLENNNTNLLKECFDSTTLLHISVIRYMDKPDLFGKSSKEISITVRRIGSLLYYLDFIHPIVVGRIENKSPIENAKVFISPYVIQLQDELYYHPCMERTEYKKRLIELKYNDFNCEFEELD